MARNAHPRGTTVAWVELTSKGALVGYRHPDDRGQKTYRHGDGGQGNYPDPQLIKGARSVAFRGMTVSGYGSRVGFVLSPAHATCQVEGDRRASAQKKLVCKLHGDTSGGSLRGVRIRRGKKRAAPRRKTATRRKRR